MYIIDSDRVKCKYCLEILNEEEKISNTNICNECATVIDQVPELLSKMDQHILIVNNFIKKYFPTEISIDKAIAFLEDGYEYNHSMISSENSINPLFSEMVKFGIKISGKMLVASFIPRVVEIVKYSTLKKVHAITVATEQDKLFLHNYWLDHYSFLLPDDWIHVIHLSFIQRKKSGFEEKFYDFPSCVIDKFYTLYAEKPIPEMNYKIFTPEEFFASYMNYTQIIDLQQLKGINPNTDVKNSLQNSIIISIMEEPPVEEEEFFDDDWERRPRHRRTVKYDNFYYSKNEKLFLVISYFELELLVIKNLLKYIKQNNAIPANFAIELARRKRVPDYLKIYFQLGYNFLIFKIYANNYGIADIHAFYEKLKSTQTLNLLWDIY